MKDTFHIMKFILDFNGTVRGKGERERETPKSSGSVGAASRSPR